MLTKNKELRISMWNLYTVGHPLSRYVVFCFLSEGPLLGRTLTAVSANRPVEHVKKALQNIKTEWTRTPHSVLW